MSFLYFIIFQLNINTKNCNIYFSKKLFIVDKYNSNHLFLYHIKLKWDNLKIIHFLNVNKFFVFFILKTLIKKKNYIILINIFYYFNFIYYHPYPIKKTFSIKIDNL